jgi:SseB protein N-terminal domain
VLHFAAETEFTPLDEEERALLDAAARGDRKEFLRTLLGVRQIWVPVVEGGDLMLAPGRPGFQWYVDESSGRPTVPLYTGPGRMRDAMGGHPFVLSDLAKVLRFWPDPALELVVNGGTPIGASIPGDRVTAMSEQVDADFAARLASDFPAQSDAERQMFDVRTDPEMTVKVLLDTTVFLPVWSRTPPAVQTRPGDPAFPWSAVPVRGRPSVLAFTSFDWMKAAVGTTGFVMPTFAELIGSWPDDAWGVSVNPGTPIEVALTGDQIRALGASGAGRPAEVVPPIPDGTLPQSGAPAPATEPRLDAPAPPQADPALVDAPQPQPQAESRPDAGAEPDSPPGPWAIMQKVVPHDQVAWHLEQAYDRVAGFVHRVQDVVDLNTPKLLYDALGLLRDGTPFRADDTEVHVIRWPAYRSGLYRVPFGGPSEEAVRAWGDSGWVLEAPPFGGDGFAPGSAGSIREYKVDSMRLPHGSEMYAIGGDGSERFVARYDADRLAWGDNE